MPEEQLIAIKDALLAAEKNNGDIIRVGAPAPAATTIVLRKTSAVAPVAVNEVLD